MVAVVDERGTQARPHGAGMSGAVECHYYGRDFTTQEMGLLCSLIGGPPALNRHALSKEFCRRIRWLNIRWLKPDGLIALPPPKWRQNRPGPIVFGPKIEPPLIPAPATLDEVRPLDLRLVVRDTREGKRWNEFVARYHYLGYKTLVGTQMRYAVHDRSPCSALHRRVEARATRPLHRLDAATAREEPPPSWSTTRGSSSCPGSRSPTWARTSSPSSASACPRTEPGATTQPPCHRDLRPDPALHWRRLQGIGLDPRRNHSGTWALRQVHETRPTEKGHLASPSQKKLETNSQPLKSARPSRHNRMITTFTDMSCLYIDQIRLRCW